MTTIKLDGLNELKLRLLLLSKIDGKKQKNILPSNRSIMEKWITEHYEELFAKFDVWKHQLDKKTLSKTDILHDTIIRLYYADHQLTEKEINRKFKINDNHGEQTLRGVDTQHEVAEIEKCENSAQSDV